MNTPPSYQTHDEERAYAIPLSLLDAQQLLHAEQQAEQQALTALRGASFQDCLVIHGIAPAREASTLKGRAVTLRGSDIYDQRTWKKFLTSINQAEAVLQHTGMREGLIRHYITWLLHEHTERYRALSHEVELAWLEQVVTLAVTRRIMEQKYEAYAMQGLPAFANPQIAHAVGQVLLLNCLGKEAARLIHHIVKEPEQARLLIAQFYEENERQMQARSLLPPGSLPALQAGDDSPLALPMREEEKHHE
jgi:hypothetical protein